MPGRLLKHKAPAYVPLSGEQPSAVGVDAGTRSAPPALRYVPDIAPDFSPRIEDDEESNADSPDAPAGEDDDDDDNEQPVRPIRTGQPPERMPLPPSCSPSPPPPPASAACFQSPASSR